MTTPAPLDSDEIAGDLTDHLRGRVKSELEPGERLLWVGQPLAVPIRPGCGLIFTAGFFVAFFGAAAIAFVRAIISPDRDFETAFWGVVLLIIALLGFFAFVSQLRQFLLERTKRAGTVYAVTDRRAIVWLPKDLRGTVAVHSFLRGQVFRVSRVERPDGTGDVCFTMHRDAGFAWDIPRGFDGVADVKRVEEQVRRTLCGVP